MNLQLSEGVVVDIVVPKLKCNIFVVNGERRIELEEIIL